MKKLILERFRFGHMGAIPKLNLESDSSPKKTCEWQAGTCQLSAMRFPFAFVTKSIRSFHLGAIINCCQPMRKGPLHK